MSFNARRRKRHILCQALFEASWHWYPLASTGCWVAAVTPSHARRAPESVHARRARIHVFIIQTTHPPTSRIKVYIMLESLTTLQDLPRATSFLRTFVLHVSSLSYISNVQGSNIKSYSPPFHIIRSTGANSRRPTSPLNQNSSRWLRPASDS